MAAGVVSFPDVGAIMLKDQQTEVHPVSHQFDPPHSYWLFNPFLAKKDREFISWLKTSLGISDAEKAYLDYAQQLKKKLDQDQNFYWEQIGSLKAIDGKWIFESAKESDPAHRFFGLPSFESPAIIRSEKKEPSPQPKATVTQKREETKQILPEKGQEDQPEETRKLRPAVWLSAACILLIALLGIMMVFDISLKPLQADAFKVNYLLEDWFGNEKQIEMEPILTNDLARFSISPEKELKLNTPEEVAEETTVPLGDDVINTPSHSESTQSSNQAYSKGYYLILGSFKDQTNAEDLKATLLQEGVEAHVFFAEGKGFYRTGYFLTSDKEEAIDILKIAQDSNPDLWLLEK